jgi:Serpentine type 7TM GPCR chemoreceptor Srv
MNNAESTLTDTQQKVLILLPFLSGTLSIVSSCTIVYLVLKSGFGTCYKRILFGLSVSDILISCTLIVQPFLLPAATSTRLWAVGNDSTCTFLGTISQLSLSAMLYTGVLAFYFLLTIRFGVTEKTLARQYEPWMHAVAIGYPLLTAIMGAFLHLYHEAYFWTGCWVVDYPVSCHEENGECRNEKIGWVFMGIWIIFVMVALAAINGVIFWHVRHQNQRVRRNSLSSERQDKRINQVAVQASLYVLAFGATFIWTVISKIMESRLFTEADAFPILVLNSLFLPLTGFFNLCIYLRPRFQKTRADFPTETVLWAVRRALYGESIPPSGSSACLSHDMGTSSRLTLDTFQGNPPSDSLPKHFMIPTAPIGDNLDFPPSETLTLDHSSSSD